MTGKIQTFNLRYWFAVLSFISILLISSLSALLLSNFLTDTLLRRDAQVTKELLQSVMQAHFSPEFYQERPVTTGDTFLETFFSHIARISDVTRANIYATDRTIIWSNRKELVGQQFAVNPELDASLRGELTINMANVDAADKAEHQQFDPGVEQFVEYYIPVYAPDSEQMLVVVEIYKLPKLLLQDIRTGTRLIWRNALLGGLFLYLVLFGVVHRAARLIERQQQALVDAEKMVAVGEIAAVIAHSVRNPLAAIRTSAELLQEDASVEGGEFCKDIFAEVDRLDLWIRELLTYTRNPGEVGRQSANLCELLTQTLAEFSERFERCRVESECELNTDLVPVRGDERLLAQVLISLISNALDAMPGGGKLSLSGRRQGAQVVLDILDTGHGIPADQLSGVFKPLVTLKPNGLGMGLPLARRALESCGGSLELTSEVGVGTRATIKLQAVTGR